MHENIALNPRISAVQVQNVIGGAGEDVVVILDDRLTQVAIPAGIIHDVVVAAGRAKEAFPHDPMPARLDAPGSMHELEGRGAGREDATAENERSAVKCNVLLGGGAEGGRRTLLDTIFYFDHAVGELP